MKKMQLGLVSGAMALSLLLGACSSTQSPADVENVSGMSPDQAQTAGLGGRYQFYGQNDGMASKLGLKINTIYFAFDSSQVPANYNHLLQVNAQYLKNHPNARIRLEGNTDPRGSREYNVGLGMRRAKQVAQRFYALGVSRDQVVTVSYGEERPALLGDSEQAYRVDRRVDIVYEVK